MKKIKIFIIALFIFINCVININALDTLAFVNVNNTYLVNSHTLEFQLRIQRNSDKWLKFVNGTFQFTFPQGITLDSDFEIQLYQTDLPETVISGAGLPKKEYLIEYQKYDERFSITILGPENYIDCMEVPLDTSLLLGQFRLIKTGGDPIPNRIDWLQPQYYYQAVAYKIELDSIERNVTWYYGDDNVELHDGRNNTFSIGYDDSRPWGFELEDFWVRYVGQTNLQYGWSTRREINAVGYTVLRGYKFTDEQQVAYTDTIGTFVDYDHYIADFLSQGVSPSGFIYGEFDDQVQYRGGDYSYALWGRLVDDDGYEFDSLLSIRDVPVPHAVIVQANASPNPFNISTQINYKLDDDVYLTAFVSDLLGKQVKFLTHPETGEKFDKLLMPMGEHYTIFAAPELASQGLYNVVLLAYPINDPTIEISRAVVKVQLVKDGVR